MSLLVSAYAMHYNIMSSRLSLFLLSQEQEFRTSILRKQAAERRGATLETSGEDWAELQSGQDTAAKDASLVGASGHINFFQHLEEGERAAVPNEEYLREQKEEKEKYEKSIGYLTYLGQGSREETKQKAWFETLPTNRAEEHQKVGKEEVKRKAKALEDPLLVVNKLFGAERGNFSCAGSAKPAATASTSASLPRPAKAAGTADTQNCAQRSSAATKEHSASKDKEDIKHARHTQKDKLKRTKKKKRSKKKSRRDSDDRRHVPSKKRRRRSPSPDSSSGSSGDSSADEEAEARRIRLERLRAERLQRERHERRRADQLLSGLRGQPPPTSTARPGPAEPRLKQRYNAQFNPYLAKQNYRPS